MIIPARFNGPPGTGNGGYTSGLVAAELIGDDTTPAAEAVEVTLRVPPPLDTELVVRQDDDGISVLRGDTVVAAARSSSLDDDPVPPVPYDEAVAASRDYPGFTSHPFPTCYSCGPERTDGLRLFPGRVAEGRTAAPFVVPDDVTPATIWAALDCPGGWTIDVEARPYVMGRVTARVTAVPAPGTRCVVTGKLIEREGRKAHVATTVWDPDGRLIGAARATWIALR